ncbi:hypothetical protein F2Q69_00056849 [Brassica cretica]|uniref:Uncharacterized protein n=1 Tax=Brassica cretica TaxID=69181 RepID=A0A8S9ND84_BRACR|nr:hypothetical protein F2Q69_00056849 [Brassica cretica]
MKAITHQQETAENMPEIATVWISEKDVCIFSVSFQYFPVTEMPELAEKLKMQMPALPSLIVDSRGLELEREP